jgi:hypothetical protein
MTGTYDRFARRAAVTVLVGAAGLAGCASQRNTPPPPPPAVDGYAIHDIWVAGDVQQHMDAVNCDSPYGPWHVVISGDLAAGGWSSLDAYYDIVADPTTGTGTLTGEEHSVAVGGDRYDGTSTGTVQVSPGGEGYLITMEIDDNIIWTNPNGQEQLGGHKSRELDVIPATEQECP